MYEGKPHRLFAKYAIPQMIGLLFNSVYVIVDGIFIGNRLGRGAMAAAAVSVPFVEILIALSMAVAFGAGVLISGQLARGEKRRALQTFHAALLCAAWKVWAARSSCWEMCSSIRLRRFLALRRRSGRRPSATSGIS